MSPPTRAAAETSPLAGRKRRWFRVIAILGGLLASWAIAEIAIRISGVNNDFRELPTSMLMPRRGGPYELSACGHVPYATIRFRYPTNPRGYFDAENSVDHTLNSVGWRDQEHARNKPDGTFRVLGLGDSYLFGQGVKPNDRCLDQLAGLLQKSRPDLRIEAINTGQPGYNTVQEAGVLRRCGWRYQPDLVILHFVPNDVEPDIYTDKPKVEFFTEYSNSFIGQDRLSRYSEVWALGRRVLLGQMRGRDYVRHSINSFTSDPAKWPACRAALADIAGQCEEHEAKLLIVLFPFFLNLNGDYPFQVIHDRVQEFCRDEQLPCLDLREEFRAYSGPELWVHPTDQHPNETAHRLAAEAIAKFCEEHPAAVGFPAGNETKN